MQYQHLNYPPCSDLIQYRGQSKQIDKTATVIAILAQYPGSTWTQIVDRIWPKQGFGYSRSDMHNWLKELCNRDIVTRTGNYYYLVDDALGYNMGQVKSVQEKMADLGLGLDQTVFLTSGLVMTAECARAQAQGLEWDPFQTNASSPVSQISNNPEDWDDDSWDEDREIDEYSQDEYTDEQKILLDWFPEVSGN